MKLQGTENGVSQRNGGFLPENVYYFWTFQLKSKTSNFVSAS